MIKTLLQKEVINGVICIVQTLFYKNGSVVRRLIDCNTGLPIAILEPKK